jgi:hypothetical protein
MKAPTVVIAGSRALPHGQAARVLVRFLAGLPPDATILLRRGLFTQPGIFESQVEKVVDLIGLKLEWCQPSFSVADKHHDLRIGRRLTWARDVEMIDRADLVLTFILEEQIGDEESGTAALAEKAIAANVPVYSYAMLVYGKDDPILLERVGEHDPENRWADLVPAV